MFLEYLFDVQILGSLLPGVHVVWRDISRPTEGRFSMRRTHGQGGRGFLLLGIVADCNAEMAARISGHCLSTSCRDSADSRGTHLMIPVVVMLTVVELQPGELPLEGCVNMSKSSLSV